MKSLQLHLMVVVALLAVYCGAPAGWAQSPPGPLGPAITGANPPNAEQSAEIKRYAAHWTAIIKNPTSKSEEIEEARTRLLAPLGNVNVSLRFRSDYADAALPDLEHAVTQGKLHAGVNAIIAAAAIGGDRPATLLVNQSHRDTQAKWQLRLRAAAGCATLFAGNTLEGRKIVQSVTRLRDAARAEDHPLVLRQQLAAIEAADQARLQPEERVRVRALLVEALPDVVENIAKNSGDHTDQRLTAVFESLHAVRQKFLIGAMDPSESRTAGLTVGPAIHRMLQIVLTQWDKGHADAQLKQRYSVMIGLWEGFLPRIDAGVRGGATVQTTMRQAWDAGDKAKFEAELAKWSAVFTATPYAAR